MTAISDYRKALAKTRKNDEQHDAKMSIIANRGGITLDELMAMSMHDKGVFITKFGGDYDRLG